MSGQQPPRGRTPSMQRLAKLRASLVERGREATARRFGGGRDLDVAQAQVRAVRRREAEIRREAMRQGEEERAREVAQREALAEQRAEQELQRQAEQQEAEQERQEQREDEQGQQGPERGEQAGQDQEREGEGADPAQPSPLMRRMAAVAERDRAARAQRDQGEGMSL